jgi:hypothetical protein
VFSIINSEMQRKGLNWQDLAKSLHLNISTVVMKLNGIIPITLEEAVRIRDLMCLGHIPLEDIFAGDQGEVNLIINKKSV